MKIRGEFLLFIVAEAEEDPLHAPHTNLLFENTIFSFASNGWQRRTLNGEYIRNENNCSERQRAMETKKMRKTKLLNDITRKIPKDEKNTKETNKKHMLFPSISASKHRIHLRRFHFNVPYFCHFYFSFFGKIFLPQQCNIWFWKIRAKWATFTIASFGEWTLNSPHQVTNKNSMTMKIAKIFYFILYIFLRFEIGNKTTASNCGLLWSVECFDIGNRCPTAKINNICWSDWKENWKSANK